MARKKRSANNMNKRIAKQITGLVFKWVDKDPLAVQSKDKSIQPLATHKNPLYNTMADLITHRFSEIIFKRSFYWQISLDVVFQRPDGELLFETVIKNTEVKCVFGDLNDNVIDEIKSVFHSMQNLMDTYVECRFTVELLGH